MEFMPHLYYQYPDDKLLPKIDGGWVMGAQVVILKYFKCPGLPMFFATGREESSMIIHHLDDSVHRHHVKTRLEKTTPFAGTMRM